MAFALEFSIPILPDGPQFLEADGTLPAPDWRVDFATQLPALEIGPEL
ncbi:hypothetical protein [Leptolyngbya sp. PCC 6406]|nr:hypothetical protein [Leptolyngbya sp. PCC 6406]